MTLFYLGHLPRALAPKYVTLRRWGLGSEHKNLGAGDGLRGCPGHTHRHSVRSCPPLRLCPPTAMEKGPGPGRRVEPGALNHWWTPLADRRQKETSIVPGPCRHGVPHCFPNKRGPSCVLHPLCTCKGQVRRWDAGTHRWPRPWGPRVQRAWPLPISRTGPAPSLVGLHPV